jgi:hypothetical protein
VASAIRPKFILFGFGGAPKWVLRRKHFICRTNGSFSLKTEDANKI